MNGYSIVICYDMEYVPCPWRAQLVAHGDAEQPLLAYRAASTSLAVTGLEALITRTLQWSREMIAKLVANVTIQSENVGGTYAGLERGYHLYDYADAMGRKCEKCDGSDQRENSVLRRPDRDNIHKLLCARCAVAELDAAKERLSEVKGKLAEMWTPSEEDRLRLHALGTRWDAEEVSR